MGQYYSPEDVRERFVEPLKQLAREYDDLCRRWAKAHDSDKIARRDLLLNNVAPETGLANLRKLLREADGKLEDAIAGVYRYRDAERRHESKADRKKRRKSG